MYDQQRHLSSQISSSVQKSAIESIWSVVILTTTICAFTGWSRLGTLFTASRPMHEKNGMHGQISSLINLILVLHHSELLPFGATCILKVIVKIL